MSQGRLQITLTLRSPAHFGAGPQEGNILRTLRHMPGPALRGALAFHYRDELPGPAALDEDFFHWAFLSGRIRWPELRPAGEPFVPRSLRRCKERTTDPPEDEIWTSAPRRVTCRVCGGPLERAEPATVATRLITRTALDPSTRSARDGSLHTIEVLEEGQAFIGDLLGDAFDPRWSRLTNWLAEAATFPPAVGGGRSRGLGAVEIAIRAAVEPTGILDRMRVWNGGQTGPTHFAVTLASPVILRDELWRFRRGLTASDLSAADPALTDTGESDVWVDATRTGGWNGAARLPKAEALAIAAGSVFTFTSPATPDILAPALAKLEETGLGERQAEGFGRVVICHPGHIAYRQEKNA